MASLSRALLLICASLPCGSADVFLTSGVGAGLSFGSLSVRSEELQAALGSVMGCTSGTPSDSRAQRVAVVREQLTPIWQTLPKHKADRVDWRFVRYLAHRHFMHRFGVIVRGLEPSINVNTSFAGDASIFSQDAPALAQQLSGSRGKHGFSLGDAAVMVAALEQLLFDSDSNLLEKIYKKKGFASRVLLGRSELQALMTDYMVYWMGFDEESVDTLLADRNLLDEHIPHWQAIVAMVTGTVRALEYTRQKVLHPSTAHTAFQAQFTFEDAVEVAGNIGRNFAFFWEGQCQDIKSSLLALDTAGTGRVRLPDFYGANKDGAWRFGESEEYLRELGALDESSSWRGKQVIVSNYMQAISNCVVSRPHYLVCCINECEEMMGYVEAAVGAAVASPADLLNVAENLTNGDDELAKIDDALRSQLYSIARNHGGMVPLHGRLFAQWLHYAFPRECPFPHKTRAASTRTPQEFGDGFTVTEAEVALHVTQDVIKKLEQKHTNVSAGEWQMSQWSEEEELLGDYTSHLGGPIFRQSKVIASGGAVAAFVGLLFWAVSHAGQASKVKKVKTHHV